MTIFAKRLREALEMREMKPIDLARKTKIGKSSISTYLAGEYLPKHENVYKIARVLDVNPDWLVGMTDIIDIPPYREAKISMDKYRLLLAALNSLGWEEKLFDMNGEEITGSVLEDEDYHIVLTNGMLSFEISRNDEHAFENDLNDFVIKRIQELMVKASAKIAR